MIWLENMVIGINYFYLVRLFHSQQYSFRHVGTMEMADYWILEKDLIPKLFKVIVPRFQNSCGPYTQVFKLPIEYPGLCEKE